MNRNVEFKERTRPPSHLSGAPGGRVLPGGAGSPSRPSFATKLFARSIIAGGLALLLAAVVPGCTSSTPPSSAPKPGSGIAEYREVVRESHRAVAATVKSLESLAQPSTQPLLPHPALPGFDRALYQLELASIKSRARAEAIIARGQGYFDEWKGTLAGITNQPAARADTDRYNRLLEHFERVRQRSGEVREEFRPFMMQLREFRARLDRRVPPTDAETSRQELNGLTAAGRRVLETLESVSTALNEAETALRQTLAAKR
jgi:hypothetical protein